MTEQYAAKRAQEAAADARIKSIVQSTTNGTITEAEARWAIVREIVSYGIPAIVARTASGIDWQTREDVQDRLEQLIERRATGTAENDLDLSRILNGASALAWARKLCTVAVPSALRDIRRATTEHVILVDQTAIIDDENGGTGAATAFRNNAVDGGYDELDEPEFETLTEAADEFEAAAHRSRRDSTQRIRLAARALRGAFHLPEVIRPEDFMDREWARDALTNDPSLARESASALLALIERFQDGSQREIDDRLLALWDDYTAADLERLVARPAEVAHTIALAAISSMPKPSRNAETAVLQTMRIQHEPASDQYRPWRGLTRALLDSWLAVETEAVSAFDTRGELNDEKRAKRLGDALQWNERAALMAAWPGAPLGATVEDVRQFIADAIAPFNGGIDADQVEVAPNARVTA